MTNRPYTDSYLPVSRASDALRNQADTILDELHISITRAQDIRAKMKRRAEERARVDACVAAWDVRTKEIKARNALWHLMPPAF